MNEPHEHRPQSGGEGESPGSGKRLTRAALTLAGLRGALFAFIHRGNSVGSKKPDQDEVSESAELLVAVLLVLAGCCGAAFVLVYALGANTQLLGLSAGVGALLLGAALAVASFRLVSQRQAVEERGDFARPDRTAGSSPTGQSGEVADQISSEVKPITRRKLLGMAGAAAGAGLGAATVIPLASLGPATRGVLQPSPWQDGVRLIDEQGRPVLKSALETGSTLTAFAEGSDHRNLASSVAVIRVEAGMLDLPEGRGDWAPEGFMAFSRICPHAQCAVGIFRYPLDPENSPGPALVCPCHYSTFDVVRGGKVIFGPASRDLPQLPLRFEDDQLVAAGDLSEAAGASWSQVRDS
jgi:ubiquinol-cytochrome c reductase iron-sulfur subunit